MWVDVWAQSNEFALLWWSFSLALHMENSTRRRRRTVMRARDGADADRKWLNLPHMWDGEKRDEEASWKLKTISLLASTLIIIIIAKPLERCGSVRELSMERDFMISKEFLFSSQRKTIWEKKKKSPQSQFHLAPRSFAAFCAIRRRCRCLICVCSNGFENASTKDILCCTAITWVAFVMTHKISFHFSIIFNNVQPHHIIFYSLRWLRNINRWVESVSQSQQRRAPAQHLTDWHQLKDIITYDSAPFAFISSTAARARPAIFIYARMMSAGRKNSIVSWVQCELGRNGWKCEERQNVA